MKRRNKSKKTKKKNAKPRGKPTKSPISNDDNEDSDHHQNPMIKIDTTQGVMTRARRALLEKAKHGSIE